MNTISDILLETFNNVVELQTNMCERKFASVIIPKEVKNVGNYAFAGCEDLTKVDFSSKPDSIANTAFLNCQNLAEINAPWHIGTVPGAPWGAINANINYKSAIYPLIAEIEEEDYKVTGVGAEIDYISGHISNYTAKLSMTLYGDGTDTFQFMIFLPEDYKYSSFYVKPPSRLDASVVVFPVQSFMWGGVTYKGYLETIEGYVTGIPDWSDLISVGWSNETEYLFQNFEWNGPSPIYPDDTILTDYIEIGSSYYKEYEMYQHTISYNIKLSNFPAEQGKCRISDSISNVFFDFSTDGRESYSDTFAITIYDETQHCDRYSFYNELLSKQHDQTIDTPLLEFVYNKFSTQAFEQSGAYEGYWISEGQFLAEV